MGEVLGARYELEQVVGSGGTGTVHRARDLVLDRQVAVKVLRAGASGDELHRSRLRAEAQLAGSLQHPGIAQVFDFGEDDSVLPPSPYLVMQYVEGSPLSDLLRQRRRLPAEEVMGIVARVAAALGVAHEAGIVHRDLKPGNVLITPEGRPVLVDFGIARSESLEPLTLTGTIVGTVDYLSPEQASGRSATPLSDVYALGMVAYEALTGQRPFRRESQVATAIAHLHDEAPPLPDDVPPAVRDLVTSMIDKDPAQRPESAAEVARRAAELAGDGLDLGATTVSSVVPAPPGRRTRARAWALTAAAVLVAVVATVAVVSARPAPAPDVVRQHPVVGDEVGARGSDRVRLDPGTVLGLAYPVAARRLEALGLVARRREAIQEQGVGTVVAADRTGRLPVGTVVTLFVAVPPATEPTTPVGDSTGGSGVRSPAPKGTGPGKGKGSGKAKGHGKK